MKRVAVMGASGRMGQELIQLLRSGFMDLEFAVGAGKGSSEFVDSPSAWDASAVDAVVDFSLPEAFGAVLQWSVANNKPLVSGTTGLSSEQFEKMNQAGAVIPLLWSPNMSLGVAVLKKALSVFSGADWFDFAIEEFHHNKKIDRPSGTAIHLQKALESNISREISEVSAVRGGGIYGIHSVFAMSEDEMLEFKHTALNRSVFASGALKALFWLVEQNPGLYNLDHVIEKPE